MLYDKNAVKHFSYKLEDSSMVFDMDKYHNSFSVKAPKETTVCQRSFVENSGMKNQLRRRGSSN